MKAEPQVRGDAWRDFGRQVAAVGIGGVVAVFGGFVGFMGALSCLAGCQGLTPGIVVAYAGLAIMAGSPLVISRVGAETVGFHGEPSGSWWEPRHSSSVGASGR